MMKWTAVNGRRRAEDGRRRIADCRLPTADCRLPTADCRLPTAHCRLPTDRRASVLIVILVCFVVAAAMFAMLARQSLAERRAADVRLWAAQANWIAEAAVKRTTARLAADAKYAGETWTISAAEMGGKQAAQARIHIEPVAGRPGSRLLRIEADYPDDPVHRTA